MAHALYVIGDIHGCFDRLKELMGKIKLHQSLLDRSNTTFTLVFVGDYIDRGPDSKGVLLAVKKMVSDPLSVGFNQVIALTGNHEDMMTDFSARDVWLWNGGIKCLNSFDPEWHNKSVVDIVTPELFSWVRDLPTYAVVGKVAIAHAGIDEPDMTVEEHSREELIWSRRLRRGPHKHYQYTVHGHTPMDQAYVGQHVAYIDTGAVFTQEHSENKRKLTALFIPDANDPSHKTMELIQA